MRRRNVSLLLAVALLLLAMGFQPLPAASDSAARLPDGIQEIHMVLEPGTAVTQLTPDSDAEALSCSGGTEAWQAVKFDGFEGPFPNTWKVKNSPSWGVTNIRAHVGMKSAWCAGSTMAAPGPYAPNMKAWLIYGPFSLQCALFARVDFCYFMCAELHDKFAWMASVDGYHFDGYGVSDGREPAWHCTSFDLNDVPTIGDLRYEPKVWLAFAFTSDASGQGEGAYLDDVTIWRNWFNNPPTADTITPNSGSAPAGTKKVFTTTWSDPDGYAELTDCYFSIGTAAEMANNVQLLYKPSVNKLYIRNNPGTAWWGGYAPGSANLLENAQGRVYCSETSVKALGNTLIAKWSLLFKSAFKGQKTLWLRAVDVCSAYTGWKNKGIWTIL